MFLFRIYLANKGKELILFYWKLYLLIVFWHFKRQTFEVNFQFIWMQWVIQRLVTSVGAIAVTNSMSYSGETYHTTFNAIYYWCLFAKFKMNTILKIYMTWRKLPFDRLFLFNTQGRMLEVFCSFSLISKLICTTCRFYKL